MSYSPQTATFASIVLAIQDRLSLQLELDKSKVRVAASDDYSVVGIDDKFLYIRPYGPQPFTDSGGGRRATVVTRRVRLYVYTRSDVDVAGDDVLATAGDFGHFSLEEQVYEALTDWWPVTRFPNGTVSKQLSIEPLHPIDSSAGPPQRDPEDNNIGLIRSMLDFECKYLLKINVVPAP